MKKTIAFLTAAGLICLFSTTGTRAQSTGYEALLGIWDVQTGDGQYSFTFDFKTEGEKLKGIYTGPSGQADMQNLKFEEGNLSFSVDLSGMVIDFRASVADGKLEGGLSLEYGEADIFGTKRK